LNHPINQSTNSLSIPLTAHPLRFTCRAVEPILWHPFKGSALRGAFAGVLRRTFCPEWRATETDALHVQLCPVCQMLAAPKEEETPGDVRRPYAIRPPLDEELRYEAGRTFSFTITLFGESLLYLPYLVLTAGGMGATGVGRKDAGGKLGRFEVEGIDSVNPLSGESVTLLGPGERMVQAVSAPVTHEQVLAASAEALDLLTANQNRLALHFHTPTRLTQDEHKMEKPEPFQTMKAAVLRVTDLSAQYGGGRPTVDGRPLHLKTDIYPHADRVQVVTDETRWWDVSGYSGRLDREQKMGGFVGRVVYEAADWRPLLPWLLWASQTQLGKNIVKGCGWYTVAPDGQPDALHVSSLENFISRQETIGF